jgi:16S rRNA (guanine527-N7)-methyltransferase
LREGRRRGFLGPGPLGPQLEHAVGFARACREPPQGLAEDLGSGGGLPGLVLAVTWAASTWVLVESQARRCAFLYESVAALGLVSRVKVVCLRAEVVGRQEAWRGAFALVVARSFARPGVTAECAAPLLRVGGRLVVSEPPDDEDARWPDGGLAGLGMADEGLVVAGARYRVVRQVAPCPPRYPRRPGVPAKRPLF